MRIEIAWENLDDRQLAQMLADPARNGQRSLEKLYDHMANDELVGWAWHPGGTRRAPAMTREQFARLVREWIDNGAVAPAVAGSKTSPTVLPGQNSVSMNLKFLRKDINWDRLFLAETQLSLSVLAVPSAKKGYAPLP